MTKPAAATVAAMAVERLRGPEIPYGQEDCQGFIKECIRLCGGKLDSGGTNDIYRNHCFEVSAFDPKRPGDTRPGDMLFICEQNGQEPERFRGDGIGNVNHIGVYCGMDGAEVVHSSQSRGKVAASTIRNAWNRRGRLKCLDYESEAELQPEQAASPAPTAAPQASPEPGPGQAKVVTTTSGLYLRKLPGRDGERIKQMPIGTVVNVLRVEGAWAQVRWDVRPGLHHVGWCCVGENGVDYLRFG